MEYLASKFSLGGYVYLFAYQVLLFRGLEIIVNRSIIASNYSQFCVVVLRLRVFSSLESRMCWQRMPLPTPLGIGIL
jgi:hypothetical protein